MIPISRHPFSVNNVMSQINDQEDDQRIKPYFMEAALAPALTTPIMRGPLPRISTPITTPLKYGIPKRFNDPEPIYYGGELPEIVVTPEYVEEPIYYGGELPEVEIAVPDPHINGGGGDGYAGRYRNDPENQSPWYIPSFLWR